MNTDDVYSKHVPLNWKFLMYALTFDICIKLLLTYLITYLLTCSHSQKSAIRLTVGLKCLFIYLKTSPIRTQTFIVRTSD